MRPATLARERQLARDWRPADDRNRQSLLDVRRGDVEGAHERRAHWAWPVALTAAIEQARVERDAAEERWLELAEQAEMLAG